MPQQPFYNSKILQQLKNIFFFSLILSSCIVPKKYQKGKPFVVSNKIEVTGGNFTKDEMIALKQRLNAQLDDSSKVNVVDKYFIRHIYNNPPAYDSGSAGQSARNMRASMSHIGYYKSQSSFKADTSFQTNPPQVKVFYSVQTGKPTLIDTVTYNMRHADLQQLTMQNIDNSFLIKGKPVSKAAVLGEITRLVLLFRNNGYYKFTSDEIKVKGDTTSTALTTITDDIFERLRLLSETQKAKDSPTIKLAVVLNPPVDSSKIRKYFINNIFILPDYQPGDNINDSSLISNPIKKRNCDTCESLFTILYHKKLFSSGFLHWNLFLKRGDIYRLDDYYKTLNSFSKAGVWQTVNIQIIENKKQPDKIDIIIQLMPEKKFLFTASLEASYSANSNANSATVVNAGNLLGISGNLSVLDRNLNKEAIKMTNSVRAGVELNLKPDSSNNKNIINSNELSFSNNIIIPRFIWPFKKVNRKQITSSETFFNTSLSYIKRINLFDMQSVNFAIGFDWTQKPKKINKPNRQWVWKPLNLEFNRLFNQTHLFDSTLQANPFLKYSFNTALVAGLGLGSLSYWYTSVNPKNNNRYHTLKLNLEESGLILGRMDVLKKYLRQFLKSSVEYTYTDAHPKSTIATRFFAGVGVPFKRDTTLPFFKQYFGGGSNSMRGWPVRGIGRGSQPLNPFGNNTFNDRTGDIQLEGNFEYRYNIAQIIPNSLVLKGALFLDCGNVWNLRNSKPDGSLDSAQFKFKNLYKELGVDIGTGFRLDFTYFVLRLDLGFRVKRPDISANDGWQFPEINFNNLFKRGELVPDPLNPTQMVNDERYRKWRYENFNFTIGISYPF